MAEIGRIEPQPRVEDAHLAVLRSQVASGVLSLVIERPSYGYEISQRFEARFGAFLSASRSAIYAALVTLADAELVERMSARAPRAARRGAKAGPSFRATAVGARAYRYWLVSRVRSDPARLELLTRLASAGVGGVDAALDFIAEYERACIDEARLLPRREQDIGEEASEQADVVASLMKRLLVDSRRQQLDAELRWITTARAELRVLRERRG